MKVEMINENSFRAKMTVDYLEELGIDLNELARGYFPYVNVLIEDIMTRVYEQFDRELQGAIGISVAVLDDENVEVCIGEAAQMEQLASVGYPSYNENNYYDDNDDEETYDDSVDTSVIYRFNDIEDVIDVSNRVVNMHTDISSLFLYEGKYHLYVKYEVEEIVGIDDEFEYQIERNMRIDECEEFLEDIMCVLEEYAVQSHTTIHMLKEYGNCIIENEAFEKLVEVF